MSRGPTAAAALIAAVVAVLPGRAGTAADAALAPYAALARSPQATELLARARAAMERHWETAARADGGERIAWPGVPVTLYVSLADGRATRACVGRAGGAFATLSEALDALAVEALGADRRRPPVGREELARLRVVLTFAGEGEAITDPMLADPGREGFSIATARGVVAFLPGEARTIAWALRETRRIGVLAGPTSGGSYRRFPVVVLSEPEARTSSREAFDETR
jgi:AMMECR1 domain-containing protein